MDEVVARYVALFAQLEARLEGSGREIGGQASAVLPEPEWESLRQALFGPGGPLAISTEMARTFLDQTPARRLDELNGAIEQLNATHPGGAGPGDGDERRARSRSIRTSSSAAIPAGPARRCPGGSSGCSPAPNRQPFQKGSGRLELAQAIADASGTR